MHNVKQHSHFAVTGYAWCSPHLIFFSEATVAAVFSRKPLPAQVDNRQAEQGTGAVCGVICSP